MIKGLALTLLFSLASVSTVAQAEQKLAVVNVQQILVALPQFAAIDQTIQAEYSEQIQEVQRLQNDGNFLLEKLQRERATMSETQIKELEEQVVSARQQLQAIAQPLQQAIQQRTDEERRKLVDLIQQAISGIAAKDGYDMVLSVAAVPYFSPKSDISQQVLDQLTK